MSYANRLLFVALLSSLSLAEATAGPLAPTKASDLVTATKSGAAPACPVTGLEVDWRLLEDGTIAPFVVPPGQVFVLTGYEFHHNAALPNGSQVLGQVSIQTPTAVAFVSSTSVIMTDFNGFSHVQLPSGIAVKPPAKVCLTAGNPAQSDLTLHGFLVRDK